MKILFLVSILLISTLATYENYWKKGDDLLGELQNGKKEIFIVTFYNPTSVKDDYSREIKNKRIQDELQSDVLNLEADKPLKIRYTSIDVTDKANDNLFYKAGLSHEWLVKGPVVLATCEGVGKLIWGPTLVKTTHDYVKEIQQKAQPKEEAKPAADATKA